jgi:hypothetical protein
MWSKFAAVVGTARDYGLHWDWRNIRNRGLFANYGSGIGLGIVVLYNRQLREGK